MAEIKIVIVDDHEMVRNGLSVMLEREEDFTVIGEANNGKEAVELVGKLQPDVVLMDLRMPEMDGVEAMRQIRAKDDSVEFLVLTTFDSDEYIFDAIEAGAKGYLLKDTSREELFKAVRTVNRGESLIEPAVVSRVLDRLTQLSQRVARGPDHLTLSDRELEVLQLMAKGSANKQIAGDLSITESTVKTHVANIFQKLEVSHRTEAVTKAMSQGIIKL
ncbi:MAG: response regulator transcription factor [Chloroflexi bacterium]|nr:response regulator transcription factor [Chloroflexota bacterium]